MGEVAQLITSLATLIAAVGALLLGWINRTKVEEIHAATNGLTAKLVAATASSSKAEGNLEGRAELKEEQKS